jgi:hypothetical protein
MTARASNTSIRAYSTLSAPRSEAQRGLGLVRMRISFVNPSVTPGGEKFQYDGDHPCGNLGEGERQKRRQDGGGCDCAAIEERSFDSVPRRAETAREEKARDFAQDDGARQRRARLAPADSEHVAKYVCRAQRAVPLRRQRRAMGNDRGVILSGVSRAFGFARSAGT